MLQATITPKVQSRDYCLNATVGGPTKPGEPFQFEFGGCLTSEHNFDIQTGEEAAKELQRRYAAGDICWYAYQYEDKTGSKTDVVGPSSACVTKYKDQPQFQKTVAGVHRAFLDYVDRIKVDPNAQIPDIRKYLDIPKDWYSGEKTSMPTWKKWALIGAVALAAVTGGVILYRRRRALPSRPSAPRVRAYSR